MLTLPTPAGRMALSVLRTPAQVYVDDGFTGAAGTSAAVVGGTAKIGYDAFATIAGGLAGVAAGGTVTLYDGSYTESPTIPAGITVTAATNTAGGNTATVALTGTLSVAGSVTVPSGLTATATGLAPASGSVLKVDGGTLSVAAGSASTTLAGYVHVVNGGTLTFTQTDNTFPTTVTGTVNLGYQQGAGGSAGTQGTGTWNVGKSDVTMGSGALVNNNGLVAGTATGSGKSATTPHLNIGTGSNYWRGDGTVRVSGVTITNTGGTDHTTGFSG